jgi:hypothetical protein
MIVSPSGEVVAEALGPEPINIRASINLEAASNWYVDQQRSDVVRISYLD